MLVQYKVEFLPRRDIPVALQTEKSSFIRLFVVSE